MKTRVNSTFKLNAILAIAFTIFMVLVISASNLKAQSVSFGPKIGYSSTTFKGNDVPDGTDPLNNFVGGVFFKYSPAGIFAFQPEILYHKKGAMDMDNGNGVKINVDYLEVPLLFKLQIPAGETFYPNIYVGPYGAFELNNNVHAQQTLFGYTVSSDGTADVEDFDYGAILGAGFDIQMEQLFLGLDARYGIGMNKILNENDDRKDFKNRTFSLMLGVGVNLE